MGDNEISIEELVAQAMALREAVAAEVEPPPVVAPPAPVGGHEEAAAVLGWFDPDTLRPTTRKRDGSGLEGLLRSVIHVVDDQGDDALSISSNHRVTVLRHLRESGRLDRALAANPASPGDRLHHLIRVLATGGTVEIEDQSLPDLHSLALVCDWLHDAGFEDLPDPERLRDRIDLLTLLEPLELLAGPDFVGRKAELAVIADFLAREQVPPAPSKRGRTAPARPRPEGRRLLVLYGPGGIGKSTLVAKVLLDLGGRDTPAASRVPFAYLDFDRPSVEATNQCLILLIEVLAQIGVEFPEAKGSCNRIREDWARVLEVPRGKRHFSLSRAVDELVTMLEQLDLARRGLVLVLDTFEVVQYRSSEEVATVLRLIDLLVEKMPADVRVVVAGRAGITRTYAQQLEVAALDAESARELLRKLGVQDRKVAERIAHRYGGDPVSLKLAASAPEAHRPLSSWISRAADWFQQLDGAVIQRRLYDRVLGHVQDERVRRLAGAGLVLRRITPDIVLTVLSRPCELGVATVDQAREVFDELRRETSLVTVEADGALVHRAELRRVVLPLLEADQPALSQALHRAAVAYYAGRPPVARERAEEIYHRLKSGDELGVVASRWMDGVQPHLESAMDELDGSRRAFLASRLGLALDAIATDAARLEDFEDITARKVRAMLDDDRPHDALAALETRTERSPRSPLTSLTAEALFAVGHVEQAVALLATTADEALVAGVTDQTYQLARMQAELVISAGLWDAAGGVLRRLEQVEALSSDRLARLGCSALGAVLARGAGSPASDLARVARSTMDDLPDAVLHDDPSLVRVVGSILAADDARDVERMARVVSLAGIPRHLEGPVRVVAAEVANVDLAASAREEEQPGMLTRRLRLPQTRSLTAAWSEFLLVADEVSVRAALREVLCTSGVDLTGLMTALARVMTTDPRLSRKTERHDEGATDDVVARVSLPREVRRMLAQALVSVFSPESLRWFLRIRLHQSLDALVPGSTTDFEKSVRQLVGALEERGLLLELVAHCLEVAPGDLRLLRTAEAVGLDTPVTGTLDDVVQRVEAGGRPVQPWLHALGQAAAQTCTLHCDGAVVGAGFLVAADLVLTADVVGARVDDAAGHCRFDATTSRHGDLVTPGTWYDVHTVVAADTGRGTGAGWALVRVDGSPGVQPVGGDAVESSTGTLRGWVDLTRSHAVPPPSGEALVLGAGAETSVRLRTSRVHAAPGGPGLFAIDRPDPGLHPGALVCSWDMDPVGLLCGTGDPEAGAHGVVLRLDAVLADLARLGLENLVGTSLA
jgi:hypothetical protein